MAEVKLSDIQDRARPKRLYEGAHVEFEYDHPKNEAKSLEAGRTICDTVEVVKIQFPGQDLTVVRVEKRHIEAYPEAYAAFKRGEEQPADGTPLKLWAQMDGATFKELAYLGFVTVEQLATASDEAKRKMGPLQQWVKKAKAFIESAKAPQNQVATLKEQLEREKKRGDKLEEQIGLLHQRILATEGTDLSESA